MLANIVQHRRGSTADWLTSDIVPLEGEVVIEELSNGTCKAKIGDGKHTFIDLSYVDAEALEQIKELSKQTNKHIDSINANLSGLKREVKGVGEAVQGLVQPSIDNLEIKYNSRLNAIEDKHDNDIAELSEIINAQGTEISKSIKSADLDAYDKSIKEAINNKASEITSSYTNKISQSKSDLLDELSKEAANRHEELDKAKSELNSKINATNNVVANFNTKLAEVNTTLDTLTKELNTLKELGYGDFVTSEMIGQIRAIEAKVAQLSTNDTNIATKVYSLDSAVTQLTRQLKTLKEQHAKDLAEVTENTASIKKTLRDADEEFAQHITGELARIWAELTDLVDDDILLYQRFRSEDRKLGDRISKVENDVSSIGDSLEAAFTEDLNKKVAELERLVDAESKSVLQKLATAEDALSADIETLNTVHENDFQATKKSIQALGKNLAEKHTESLDKIAEVAAQLEETKLNADKAFSAVEETAVDLANSIRSTAAKLDIESERIDSHEKQIAQIVQLEEGSTTGDAELQNIRVGYNGITYESAGEAVRAVGNEVRNLRNSLSSYVDTQAVDGLHYDYTGEVGLKQPYMLYLTANKEVIEESGVQIISGGTGGGSGSATSTLKIGYITPSAITVTPSDTALLYFTFSGTDSSGDSLLSASATWKIDGKTVDYGTVIDGENEFDVTKYLKIGTTRVLLTVTDDNGSIVTKTWNVQQIELAISSNFNDKLKNSAGENVLFDYIPTGAVKKTVIFKLDGQKLPSITLEKEISGSTVSYELPGQVHGAHMLEVYLEAELNGNTVQSNHIFKDIIWFDDEASNAVIGTASQDIKVKQYSTTNIVYTAYDPKNEVPSVEIKIDGNTVSTVDVKLNKDYSNTPTAIYSYTATEAGSHEIAFICGTVEKKINIFVEELADISPVTTGLVFDFNPVGRSNGDANNRLWSHGDIHMTVSDNFDWVNGGYIPDDPDGPCFCIKAGSTATIDYKLFADNNIKAKGKEFKFVFKTRNVANPDAIFLSCVDNTTSTDHVGLEMGVHEARIYGKSGKLELAYSEEDAIEFEFNISKDTEKIPMVMGYEDGVPSRPMVYDETYSFTQNTPKVITLGSPDCDLYVYRFKVYNTSLSDTAILKNFIADARTADEMISRHNRNQIYDENNKLDPDVLAEKCPWLRIYKVSAPHFTNNKSDKVANTTIQQLYKNGDPVLDNWICHNAQHSGQGTSSNNYGAAGRNLDFIMNKDGAYFELGDGTRASKITLTRESVPVAYLNAKVNIASSNNLTNAILANRYNKFNPYTRPFVRTAKLTDEYSDDEISAMTQEEQAAALIKLQEKADTEISYIKDTMEFHNCVIFIQETDLDLTTHREFADTDWHFYAIGNIGDSKKTDNTRTTDPEDKYECCVEIMDVGLPLSDFPADTMINAMSYSTDEQTGERNYQWAKNGNLGILYELIDGEYVKTADTEVNLEKTYYVDILENDDFSEDFTYGWRYITDDEDEDVVSTCKQAWIDFYRFVTTTSDEEFKARLSEYFVVDSALYYYLFTTRYCMVDNRAKNTFWHYSKTADGTRKWDLCWDYDNDTSLGLNNYGKQVYRYGLEDIDKDAAGEEIFRESDSTFFCRIRDLFVEELKSLYKDLESDNAWHAESFLNICDAWQNEFPEELWRLDIERKYLRTYTSSFINGKGDSQFLVNMCNGRMKYHRRQWERSQEQYMASKYQTIRSSSDEYHANFRVNRFDNTDTLAIKPSYQFTLTPFSYIYLNVWYGDTSRTPYSVRAVPNVPITVPCPTALEADIINIGNASAIRDFGDLSASYPKTVSIGNASRVKRLKLGNDTAGYDNTAFTTLTTGANPLLEELNIENISSLAQALNLSDLTNLKKLFAFGTKVPSVTFAQGGKIEEVELPAINNITLKQLKYLTAENFTLTSYNNVGDIVIEECPKIDQLALLERCSNLNRAKLDNVNFGAKTYEYFRDNIFKLKGIDVGAANAQLTGTVYFENLTGAQYIELATRYPKLLVSFGQVDSNVTFNYDYKSDAGIIKDFEEVKPVVCKNSISESLTEFLSEHIPYWAENDEFTYEFIGWSRTEYELDDTTKDYENKYEEYLDSSALTGIIGDRVLYPVFKANRKSYNVTFINPNLVSEEENIDLGTIEIPYGTEINFEDYKEELGIESISKQGVHDNLAKHYILTGWKNEDDELVNTVTSDLTLYAQFTLGRALDEDDIQSGGFEVKDDDYIYITRIKQDTKNPIKAIEVTRMFEVGTKEYEVAGLGGFYNHSALEFVLLPDGLLEIDGYMGAFYGCKNLVEITLPNSLETIGDYAFRDCSKLKEVYIPSSVLSIGDAAFANCESLETIVVDGNNTHYTISNNCLINKDTATLIQAMSGVSEVAIPNDVQNLGTYCFAKTKIERAIIPESVSKISSNAFNGCTKLETVQLPEGGSVDTLDASCFSGCTSLNSINLPEGLKEIKTYVFNNCALETVIIPTTVTTILDHAFGSSGSNSNSLKNVTFSADINTITEFHKKAFAGRSGIAFNLPWSEEEHTSKFGSNTEAWGAANATLNFNYNGGN